MLTLTKKKSLSYLYITILTIVSSLHPLSNTDLAFIEKYRLTDTKVKSTLDTIHKKHGSVQKGLPASNAKVIKSNNNTSIIYMHPQIPQFIIKQGLPRFVYKDRAIDRIRRAEKIRNCIKTNKLSCIVVPEKYLYHIPGKNRELTDTNYLILSQKLDIYCEKCSAHSFLHHTSDEEYRQLKKIISTIGLSDIHPGNIVRLKNGKIAIIDTEQRTDHKLFSLIPFGKKLGQFIGAHDGQTKLKHMCGR